LLPDHPNSKTAAVKAVNDEIRKLNSRIKDKKTLTLYPMRSRTTRAAEEYSGDKPKAKEAAETEFIDILGAPFVPRASDLSAEGRKKVEQFVYEKMMDGAHGQQHLHRLQRMRDPSWGPYLSPALTIIRKSIIPSTSYIIRNTPALLSMFAVKIMDTEAIQTLAALLRIKKADLTSNQKTAIALPLSLGGLGITRLEPLVEETVRSAGSAVDKKESKQRMQAYNRDQYDSLMENLEEQKGINDEVLKASATMMSEHLKEYNPAEPVTRNTSGQNIHYATEPETGSLLLRIYYTIGHIPQWFRSETHKCALCKQDIPMLHRLDHGSRCPAICKTQRHDVVKNEVAEAVKHSVGMQNVRVEPGIKTRPGTPIDLTGCYGDVDFEVKDPEEEAKLSLVVLDFGITVGGAQGREAMEKTKIAKYSLLNQWAVRPFIFLPVIMDIRGTMQPTAEQTLRYISMHNQVALGGSWSAARTRTWLGDIQARALRREFTMFILTIGLSVNCDLAAVFGTNGVLTPPSTNGQEPMQPVGCGRIAERKRTQETQLEAKTAAIILAMEDSVAADSGD
jgi:hypothetical protein